MFHLNQRRNMVNRRNNNRRLRLIQDEFRGIRSERIVQGNHSKREGMTRKIRQHPFRTILSVNGDATWSIRNCASSGLRDQ